MDKKELTGVTFQRTWSLNMMAACKITFLSLLLHMVVVATSHGLSLQHVILDEDYGVEATTTETVETVNQNEKFPMVRSDNKLYYIEHILKANFYQAWYYCKNHGMDLLSLETEEEINSIKMVLRKEIEKFGPSDEPIFFVAGRYIDNADRWIWMDSGKPFVTKPNTFGDNGYRRDNSPCVVFQYRLPTGEIHLRSADCNGESHFICRDKNGSK